MSEGRSQIYAAEQTPNVVGCLFQNGLAWDWHCAKCTKSGSDPEWRPARRALCTHLNTHVRFEELREMTSPTTMVNPALSDADLTAALSKLGVLDTPESRDTQHAADQP